MCQLPSRSFAASSRFAVRACGRSAVLAALIGSSLGAVPAFALPPGGDGVRVTIAVSGTDDIASAAALDAAGNVVMAGSTSTGDSALASITRGGFINTAFGTADGMVLYNLSTSTDSLRALVHLDDGRYVGCGIFFSPGTANDFFVARFLDNGSLDTTFNGTGYAVVPFSQSGSGGALFDQCNAVAVQADGAVVSAGVTYADGFPRVALTRHLQSGDLDTAFGDNGLVAINAASSANGSSEAHAVLAQPDGKIVIAGYATGTGNSDLLLMRLDTDGTPDATFGTGGITRTPIGSGEDIANAMVLQPDGRIVIAGSAVTDGRRDFVLARYTTAGALDTTFGTGGFTTTPVGPGDDIANALTRMPWGRLVAAGSARVSTSAAGTDIALVAYNADGTLDRYFGDLGVRMLHVSADPTANDAIYALANDIDGEHFWAIGAAAPTTNLDFLAVEFGLPDTIFRHGFDSDTAP